MKPPDYDHRIDALLRGKMLPRPVRDQLQWARLASDVPSAQDVANALVALRCVASKHAEILDLAATLERILRRAGHDPGKTSTEADELVLRLQAGCWVVNAPSPHGSVIVLGGLDWPAIHTYIAEKRATAKPGLSFLSAALGGNAPSTWDMYLKAIETVVRERIDRVKRAAENAKLVRNPPMASWNNEHHFAFADGTTLAFTWRAWGDFVVAIQGEGDYMNWYE